MNEITLPASLVRENPHGLYIEVQARDRGGSFMRYVNFRGDHADAVRAAVKAEKTIRVRFGNAGRSCDAVAVQVM